MHVETEKAKTGMQKRIARESNSGGNSRKLNSQNIWQEINLSGCAIVAVIHHVK